MEQVNTIINQTLDNLHAKVADLEKRRNRTVERNKELDAEIKRNNIDISAYNKEIADTQKAYDTLLQNSVEASKAA